MPGFLPFAVAVIVQGQAKVTTEQDYKETLAMLGIGKTRGGADGFKTDVPNAANRDESKADAFTNYPDVLKFENGMPVKSKADWEKRRKELYELFDREVYGRIPAHVPKVTWQVTSTDTADENGVKVIRKSLLGHVDNSSYPAVKVDIPLTLVVPVSDSKKKVPVIMEFGFNFRRPPGQSAARQPVSRTDEVLERGWGYAILSPASYQPDNGAGLREGIIGLVNKGKLRKKDDWGALRAWGWGASRALDYLETDPNVNAKKVVIEGISRYGKASLVAMAYEPRFAAAFVGSSGAGGAKLWRRNFGETEGNIASSGEYHWMTPNFIKYAADKTPGDLPVDQHELIALCAPRPVFVGCGSPNVEGIWVDDTGMFRATAMASPVWQLLGAKGLGTDKMPGEEHGLTDGELAFRQHSGGHTNGPNWPAFLDWFARYAK